MLLGLMACAASSGAEHASPTRRTAKLKPKAHVRSDRAAAAPSEPVIEVVEEKGIRRRAWPIRVGVPFPEGAMRAPEKLQVLGDRGALPTQVRTLARWPDGSLQWALVDFEADLSPHQHRHFQVRSAAAPAPHPSVSIRQTKAAISVDTGVLRFSVPKRGAGILHAVSVHGHRLAVQPFRDFLESDGELATARAPESVTVEEKGPVRASILLKGRYSNGFEYRIRLEAFAGQSYVRLLHTFIDTRKAPFTMLDRITLEIPVTLGKSLRYEVGRDRKPPLQATVPRSGVGFTQIDNETFEVKKNRRAGQLSGWFRFESPDVEFGLDAPFFWQEYPQAVHASASGVVYDMWASPGGRAKVGVGAAKTHEMFLVFGTPKGPKPFPAQPGRGVVAFVDPEWTAHTGALVNAISPSRNSHLLSRVEAGFRHFVHSVHTERWDDSGEVYCPPPERQRPRTGLYGMFNWGDWNYPGYHDDTKGCDAWGNQEYDLTQALALLFAATGRADVREYLTAAARHFNDVDRIHYQPKFPQWVGMNHPKNPLHFSFELGGVDLGHTWVEGLLSYYYLTGDESAREGAVAIADYLVRRLNSAVKGNPRQFGWPALALTAVYRATGNANYRRAALEYAHLGMKMHPASETPKHWKMGILGDALSYVHAATGDKAVRAWLIEYAGIVMKQQPKDVRFYPALAYVGRITNDEKMRAAARRVANRIHLGSWGKPFTIGTRTAFRIESILDSEPRSSRARITS